MSSLSIWLETRGGFLTFTRSFDQRLSWVAPFFEVSFSCVYHTQYTVDGKMIMVRSLHVQNVSKKSREQNPSSTRAQTELFDQYFFRFGTVAVKKDCERGGGDVCLYKIGIHMQKFVSLI